MVEAKPERCIVLQRPQLRGGDGARPRRRLAGRGRRRRAGPPACRSMPPTRSTSSTPRARPASPRASCATTAATPSRSRGRCGTSTASSRARFLGGLRHRLGGRALATPSTGRCCTAARRVMFEGKPVGTPDAGAFWRVIDEHGVQHDLHRADRVSRDPPAGPRGRAARPLRPLGACARCFWRASAATPTTLGWAERKLGVPVIDHYWQTETGWPVVANCLGIERLPVKPGSPTRPVPGLRPARARRRRRRAVARRDRAPWCCGCRCRRARCPRCGTPRQRFLEAYLTTFPGFYETADAGYVDEDGYLFVMARTDDIINVAGHRLSTGAIEEILAAHPDVAECAVIGVADALKGQVPIGLCRAEGGRRATARGRSPPRSCSWCATGSAPSRPSSRRRRRAPAQDPLREDPARDHAQHRRRRASTPFPPRSTTRPSSARSGRRSWRSATRGAAPRRRCPRHGIELGVRSEATGHAHARTPGGHPGGEGDEAGPDLWT